MVDTVSFVKAIGHRRTYDALDNKSTIAESRIEELITSTIQNVPSVSNSQTCRLVVVRNQEHPKSWEAIADVYENFLPPDKFESAKNRQMFRGACGAILFYEDSNRLREFQDNFNAREDKFPWCTLTSFVLHVIFDQTGLVGSHHLSGMHQSELWTALIAERFGCNFQHYNTVIDIKLQQMYDVPMSWSLQAHLVFGMPTGWSAKDSKIFDLFEDRAKFFGKP